MRTAIIVFALLLAPAFAGAVKERTELSEELDGVKNEVQSLRENATDEDRRKLDAMSGRVESLELRAVAAEREDNRVIRKELKKLHRELKGIHQYRSTAPEASRGAEPLNL